MRTTKSLTVSLPPAQLREMKKTAKKENRTMSELVRETFRRYQRDEEDRRMATDPLRAMRLLELKEKVEELRKETVKTGLSKLTDRQINAEVEAYRRQRLADSVRLNGGLSRIPGRPLGSSGATALSTASPACLGHLNQRGRGSDANPATKDLRPRV